MSEPTQSLAARRLELLQRVARQRQDLREHVDGIPVAVVGLAGNLSPARWLGASPLWLAGGAALIMVMGRGRVLRTLGTGLAIVGLLRRYRDTLQFASQLVSEFAQDQSVSRSR